MDVSITHEFSQFLYIIFIDLMYRYSIQYSKINLEKNPKPLMAGQELQEDSQLLLHKQLKSHFFHNIFPLKYVYTHLLALIPPNVKASDSSLFSTTISDTASQDMVPHFEGHAKMAAQLWYPSQLHPKKRQSESLIECVFLSLSRTSWSQCWMCPTSRWSSTEISQPT